MSSTHADILENITINNQEQLIVIVGNVTAENFKNDGKINFLSYFISFQI